MTPTERIAQELRKIYADNGLTHIAFEEMAKHVQRMVLDAEIKGLQYGRDYQPFVIDKRLEELRSERKSLDGT